MRHPIPIQSLTPDFDRLYASLTPQLRALVFGRYGFSGADADELIQDAWLLFLEKSPAVRVAPAWIAGTVRNLCRQEIKQRYRQRDCDRRRVQGETRGDGSEARIAVGQALNHLDARGRELCMRIGIARQSYEEVSGEMSLPMGSIGPLFLRAKARMREWLGEPAAG